MATYNCSKDGDHVVRAAKKHAFHDWKTVWEASPKVKKKRSNALMLFTGDKNHEGDVLTIPKKDQGTEKQSTDSEQAYKIPRQKLCLRLRILRGDFEPLKDIPFKLKISGGKTYEGKTDADGKVVVSKDDGGPDPEINNDSTKATLEVNVPQEKAGTEKNKDDKKALKAAHKLKWNLRIGRLDPVKEEAPDKKCISGVQQRLNNLGFFTGPVDGILGDNTKYAIQTFQSKFDLTIDGDPEQAALQDKLQKVHDTDAAVPKPTGTKPITATVDKKSFIKTKDKDIGHVAPQFVGGSPNAINTIVVAPEYRLTLELGDINDLFFEPETTDKGKMERLQVAGLHYFPMNHEKAGDSVKFAWDYYKNTLGGNEGKLKAKIREFVVDSNRLPPPAEDEKKPALTNFGKIRVPGGYTYVQGSGKFKPCHDGKYAMPMTSEGNHAAAEMLFADNPVLGAVPIKALIEERYGSTGPWKPAQKKWVYFQLVKPYDLPEYDAAKSPLEQLNRPDLRDSDMQTGKAKGSKVGPFKHVTAGMKYNLDDKDPQADNCHKNRGGKRGLKAAGNVLELKVNLAGHGKPKKEKDKRPGFHEAHAHAGRKDVVKEPFIEKPEEAPVKGDKHKHAVRVKSNKEGWAGIIFKPSPTGGDRYRFRIYVGPNTLESDGEDPLAVAVETGTMVVWRNVRVSRILKLPYGSMSATIQNDFKETMKAWGWDAGTHKMVADPHKYHKVSGGFLKKDEVTDVGYPVVDLTPKGDAACVYDGFVKQMARAFCEVELDPGAGTAATVKDSDYEAALAKAAAFAKANNTYNLDIDKLIITDKTKVTASNAFCLIPMKLPIEYNKVAPVGKKVALTNTKDGLTDQGGYDSWFDTCILYPFAHALADQGFRPGLTLLQMPTISPWHAIGYLTDYAIGLGWKMCIMYGGKDFFPYAALQTPAKTLTRDGSTDKLDDYGYSALAAHEWGHNLFREHAPPDPDDGSNAAKHDNKADGYCVMTYLPNEGHFCGKCLFALAGWKGLSTIP